MTSRRAGGELEDQLMTYLWASAVSATPREVHQAVAPDLAYTTVMTVLSRLWKKGLLSRERRGRAFAYAVTQPEATHRADQMHSKLRHAPDPAAVLSSFVEALDPDDAVALRRLLQANPE